MQFLGGKRKTIKSMQEKPENFIFSRKKSDREKERMRKKSRVDR